VADTPSRIARPGHGEHAGDAQRFGRGTWRGVLSRIAVSFGVSRFGNSLVDRLRPARSSSPFDLADCRCGGPRRGSAIVLASAANCRLHARRVSHPARCQKSHTQRIAAGGRASLSRLYLRMTMQIIAESTITCPSCGASKIETMPTDACQYFYECTACGTLLRPKQGDCCVFCSYGSVPCPPIQASESK
jgi:hypothetical protein